MSEPDSATPATSAKRPRPVISCLECRRKKLKCSRTHPCQQCVRIGRPGRCEYQAGQEPEPNVEYSLSLTAPHKRQRLLSPTANDEAMPSPSRPEANGQVPGVAKLGVIEDILDRVARLEHALLASRRQPNGSATANDSSSASTCQDVVAGQERPLDRSPHISSKFDEACAFMRRLQHGPVTRDIISLRAEISDIHHHVEFNHRRMQETRASATPLHPVQLPPREVCEKLAELYFDSMEHCFRILHRPQFREQLGALFEQGEHACNFGFLPQLIGALAMAVLLGTHQECESATEYSSIQPQKAISFMETFLRNLGHSDRYRLPALQVKMLCLICRWVNLDNFDDLFQLNGELLRDALVMKMDKDPATLRETTVFEGELRRRAWMTIVEVDLMLSILGKMPCMVPAYSSQPPRNVNDEEIFEAMETLPTSRSTTDWTDGICQYLLAQTFPRRLAACSQLDRAGNITAQEILSHIHYLEQVLQNLPPPMRFDYLGDKASKTPARLMARMELDISIRRPLMHLYSEGLLSCSATESTRQELRAGLVQSCLMIANYQDLFDPQYSELDVPRAQGYWDFFYSCYRQELGQATLGLCLAIQGMKPGVLTNGSSLADAGPSPSAPAYTPMKGPSYTRENLINAVKDTLEPMRRRLPFRASHVKDIVFYEIILMSLLPEQSGSKKEAAIIERLQSLVRESQDELDRAHVPNLVSRISDEDKHATAFDPLWQGFPVIDIFDAVDFG